MSFFDNMFGGKPTEQAQQAPIQVVLPTADLSAYANGAGNASMQQSGQPAQAQDPIDSLWEPTIGADGNPVVPNLPALGSGINFNLDMGKLDTHFATVDFTKGIAPELFSSVAAGGDQALAALPQIINAAVRQAVLTSAQSTAQLVKGTVTNADSNIASLVQAEIKRMGLLNTGQQNPVYSNPMYAPIVEMVQKQVLQKFPNASSEDLAKSVDNYFKKMGTDLNPSAPGAGQFNITAHNNATDTDTDWTKYFTQ